MKLVIVALLLASCGAPAQTTKATEPPTTTEAKPVTVPANIQATIDAADRDADDRALDAGRHPGEMLAFFGIGPGMTVADLAAGRGYTTELLARTVGDTGKVYAENSKLLLGFVGDDWTKRLAKPVLKNVVRVDRELEDPLPPEAKNLDAVVMVLFYHDTYWQKTDRAKMNAAILAALKPGGVYGIVDHSARAGAGSNDVKTFHRIEQSELVSDVTKAGFKLVGEASFLRNPSDSRDWNDSPREAGSRRGTSDRFVLKFVK
jgi:predicted methyltransferase